MFGIQNFVPTQSVLSAFADTADGRFKHTIKKDKSAVLKYVEFREEDKSLHKGDLLDSIGLNKGGNSNNARIIRFSDVKLMQAEAILQSGGSTGDAIKLINDVRDRARKNGVGVSPAARNISETNKKIILQWIIEERRLELAFEEGHRWYDLRRWHLGGDLLSVYGKDLTNWDFSSLRKGSGDFVFDLSNNKNLYLPIPNSELAINKNLVQNKGY